jgi:hypothetical protein
MERYDPALQRCGFGLLCLASAVALSISGIAYLVFR